VATRIHQQNLADFLHQPQRSLIAMPALSGAIDGLETVLHALPEAEELTLEPLPGQARALLFTAGSGTVQCDGQHFSVDEVAFFAPMYSHAFSLRAGSSGLQVLELRITLTAEDVEGFARNRAHYPYFITYSRCRTYRERIKSPKTVSRTLMPEHTFPRLCVGSVSTTGDDHVAAHRHPMLEQLFFGLKANACVVHADDASTDFGEDMLLHIPLGSRHSVDVAAPNELHYVWIDLFRDKSGMAWITSEHHEE
jgi:mannose-6-phosphate isomerase-like protein (cupin superfamily)